MNVEPEVLIAAVVVMAIAALVQASVGFGANLLAVPTFALLDPDLVPGPIFFAAAVLAVSTAARERASVDWDAVRWGTIGRVPGAVVGSIVLATVSDTSLQLLVGLTILVAVALSSGVVRIPSSRPAFLTAGSVSGFSATTSAIGGPPLALLLQSREGPVFRSTMGAYFALGTFVTLPAIAAGGRLGRSELLVGLALIPGAMIGFFASGPIRPYVDAGRVRPLVLMLSTISACALLIRVVA